MGRMQKEKIKETELKRSKAKRNNVRGRRGCGKGV